MLTWTAAVDDEWVDRVQRWRDDLFNSCMEAWIVE